MKARHCKVGSNAHGQGSGRGLRWSCVDGVFMGEMPVGKICLLLRGGRTTDDLISVWVAAEAVDDRFVSSGLRKAEFIGGLQIGGRHGKGLCGKAQVLCGPQSQVGALGMDQRQGKECPFPRME